MKRATTILGVAGLVLLTAALAWASSEGGGGAHHYNWMNLVYRLVNFAVFIAIIWKFGGKKISGALRSRREGIVAELDDLSRRKEDAQRRLEEVKASIANLDKEREQILAQYREQGEAQAAAIVDKAAKQAEQIKAQAAKTAENEARQAMDRMRGDVAELVAEAARKVLEDKLTDDEHQKLIDKYVTKVVFN